MQNPPLRLLTTLAVLFLLACETSYRPRGPSGGYTDFEAQPGIHYVAFEATPGTGYPVVRQYWHRRAAEVCGGPDSYMRLWTFDRADALLAETESQIRRASQEEIAMAAEGQEPDAISGRLLVEGYIVCTAGEEISDVSQTGDLAPLCSSWEPCERRRAASCEALDFLDRQLGVECTRSFEACLANGETGDECLAMAEEAARARYRDVAQNVLRRLDLERSICQAWVERGAPMEEPTAEPCRSWTENAPRTEKDAP